jgi:predicted RNA-binding protein YlqC (UPF0109 family)
MVSAVTAEWLGADGQPCRALLKGRNAQAIRELVKAGRAGITAAGVSNWALRLGAYVHQLRHDYGLNIATQREEHDIGNSIGWHGRYVLETPVRLIEPQV